MFDFNPEYLRNEKEVESKLIVQHLLPALGYSPNDWHQEVALGTIRLDFLAFASQMLPFTITESSPFCLVIEAKSPNRKLDPYVRRLRQYLTTLHTEYGLLTNGRELRIYRRTHEDGDPIFQCSGEEILQNLEHIKTIVGRDVLKYRRQTDMKQLTPLSTERKKDTVKTIAVYHNKGGVGKTTISVNLAAALRKRGYKVLLIDLDSQANSTFAAGLVKFHFEEDDDLRDNNVFHMIEHGNVSIQDVARQSHLFNNPEIDIIPAHISLIELQFKLNTNTAAPFRIANKLQSEKDNYNFVIIDTPPSRDLYAQFALIAATHLIIPSDLKPFANQGLSSVQSFIGSVNEFREGSGRAPLKVLGVLPSKISTNPRFFESTFPRQKETILHHYQFPVLDSIIFERAALSHAVNQHRVVGDLEIPDPKSIFDYADQHTGANQAATEFETLATEILTKTETI